MKTTLIIYVTFLTTVSSLLAFVSEASEFLDSRRNIECSNNKIIFEYINVNNEYVAGNFWTPEGDLISKFKKRVYGSTPEETDFVFLDQDRNNGVFFLVMWVGDRSFSITGSDFFNWEAGANFDGWILSELPSLDDRALESYINTNQVDYRMKCTLIIE